MNCESSFKAHLYSNNQKGRSAFIEKVISENFANQKNGKKSSKKNRSFLDDEQLKNLNVIFSNVSFDMIKQTNEKLQFDKFRDKGTLCWQKRSPLSNHTSNGGKNGLNGDALPVIKKQLSVGDILINDRNKSSRTRMGPKSAAPNTGLMDRAASCDKKKSVINSSMTDISSDSNGTTSNLSNSSQIVIHVCDEAKRLKQDFMCPRDLLVKEMKYFSYNLNINVNNNTNSNAGAHAHSSIPTSALSKKNLDEIDISVHCDINIFDWLMRYVKRNHPFLIEKTIASPPEKGDNADIKIINGVVKTYEPKLEVNNCVSILLSSDFLIMGELVDKCIIFIAEHLESVLQIQCVLNGISDYIIIKLAACISVDRLDTIYDKKDKLKSKLFQRKIEFLFDTSKYHAQFENSSILKRWRDKRSLQLQQKQQQQSQQKKTDDGDENHSVSEINDETDMQLNLNLNLEAEQEFMNTNYNNFLYEIENDASTLFKCKLCSKLMTKKQSEKLKCQLAILNVRGNYVYLHVPDETFDLTAFLQLLKDKLKTWQSVYWFLWALTKQFKCKKCCDWFRLVEFNRCRLNSTSYCHIHDIKITNSLFFNQNGTEYNKCTCIFINHVLEQSSLTELYSKSLFVTDPLASSLSPELRLANYLEHTLDNLEKHNDTIMHGFTQPITTKDSNLSMANNTTSNTELNDAIFFCEVIEDLLQTTEKSKVPQPPAAAPIITKENTTMLPNNRNNNSISKVQQAAPMSPVIQSEVYETSFYIDSITGKHISLLNKHILNLIKISHLQNSGFETIQSTNSTPLERNASNINSSHAYNIAPIVNTNLDLKTCLYLINQTDVRNMFNTLETLYFSKTNRFRWDVQKMTRLNQDNQREDDLNKFRDTSSNLIKVKLIEESIKPNGQKSQIANLMLQPPPTGNMIRMNSDSIMNSNTSSGGIYCRVENEWKYKWNGK